MCVRLAVDLIRASHTRALTRLNLYYNTYCTLRVSISLSCYHTAFFTSCYINECVRKRRRYFQFPRSYIERTRPYSKKWNSRLSISTPFGSIWSKCLERTFFYSSPQAIFKRFQMFWKELYCDSFLTRVPLQLWFILVNYINFRYKLSHFHRGLEKKLKKKKRKIHCVES